MANINRFNLYCYFDGEWHRECTDYSRRMVSELLEEYRVGGHDLSNLLIIDSDDGSIVPIVKVTTVKFAIR